MDRPGPPVLHSPGARCCRGRRGPRVQALLALATARVEPEGTRRRGGHPRRARRSLLGALGRVAAHRGRHHGRRHRPERLRQEHAAPADRRRARARRRLGDHHRPRDVAPRAGRRLQPGADRPREHLPERVAARRLAGRGPPPLRRHRRLRRARALHRHAGADLLVRHVHAPRLRRRRPSRPRDHPGRRGVRRRRRALPAQVPAHDPRFPAQRPHHRAGLARPAPGRAALLARRAAAAGPADRRRGGDRRHRPLPRARHGPRGAGGEPPLGHRHRPDHERRPAAGRRADRGPADRRRPHDAAPLSLRGAGRSGRSSASPSIATTAPTSPAPTRGPAASRSIGSRAAAPSSTPSIGCRCCRDATWSPPPSTTKT